jgi:diadenosine tetraphosphate (Ap4A) HIT family hydrolase
MDNCIFCKIARGEFDSAKIWEDDEFFAILDLNPNTRGMTLVLPKKHYDSYAFSMPDDVYVKFMIASKKVAKLLEKSLGVKRDDAFKEISASPQAFFHRYQGYITTVLGPRADIQDLKKLAADIKSKA